MTQVNRSQRLVGLLMDGCPWKLSDLSHRLGVSDATTTRLIESLGNQVLRVGERRGRRYFGRREMRGITESPLPIYRVLEDGKSRKLAQLTAVGETGYWCEFEDTQAPPQVYSDFPYFLAGLRPSGYLGRQIPERHPELENPRSVQHWSGDDCVRYLTRFGFDGPGDLIVGQGAFSDYLKALAAPTPPIASPKRARIYAALASETLKSNAGSSATGEQPKFLTTTAENGAVLVKFSPPVDQVVGRRVAELLVAEHLALETLREAGFAASESELVFGRNQVFLEVTRFDRTTQGRRGVVALGDLDAEFVGAPGRDSWPEVATTLVARKVLSPSVVQPVRFLWAFGRLIANTDMHRWNLSFFTEGLKVGAVAPAYDMSPTLYAPQQGHVTTPDFLAPIPHPSDGPIWEAASQAATHFWKRLEASKHVSESFRAVAGGNSRAVQRSAALATRLPGGRSRTE